MAMPLPKPVEPSFSRAINASKTSCISRSGTSRAIRLAICSRAFFLLPPGTFTRERPGVRMVSSRIMGGELTTCTLHQVQILFLMLYELAVELVVEIGRAH